MFLRKTTESISRLCQVNKEYNRNSTEIASWSEGEMESQLLGGRDLIFSLDITGRWEEGSEAGFSWRMLDHPEGAVWP